MAGHKAVDAPVTHAARQMDLVLISLLQASCAKALHRLHLVRSFQPTIEKCLLRRKCRAACQPALESQTVQSWWPSTHPRSSRGFWSRTGTAFSVRDCTEPSSRQSLATCTTNTHTSTQVSVDRAPSAYPQLCTKVPIAFGSGTSLTKDHEYLKDQMWSMNVLQSCAAQTCPQGPRCPGPWQADLLSNAGLANDKTLHVGHGASGKITVSKPRDKSRSKPKSSKHTIESSQQFPKLAKSIQTEARQQRPDLRVGSLPTRPLPG